MSNVHHDRNGPGGASLAQRLAPSGKCILIFERGDYLHRTGFPPLEDLTQVPRR